MILKTILFAFFERFFVIYGLLVYTLRIEYGESMKAHESNVENTTSTGKPVEEKGVMPPQSMPEIPKPLPTVEAERKQLLETELIAFQTLLKGLIPVNSNNVYGLYSQEFI